METQTSKTVFIEYSSYTKGQHFMTVVQTQDHKRIIIGRVYREYDKENKKSHYYATDFAGNPIFKDAKGLTELKQNFIEYGKTMAQTIPNVQKQNWQKAGFAQLRTNVRNKEVKNIRDKKPDKEKKQEVNKTDLIRKEVEQDIKNASDNKEVAPQNNDIKEEPIENEISTRESELEEIRDQNDDREQDMDRDL